jgi:hypothetical protein
LEDRIMSSWWNPCILACLVLSTALPAGAAEPPNRTLTFDNAWGAPGFSVAYSGNDGLELVYSLSSLTFSPAIVRGETFTRVTIPGAILPTNPGEPNLPGSGRYLALPNGARARVEILDQRSRAFPEINVLPSARLPFDVERTAPLPEKNLDIYGTSTSWPKEAVQLSSVRQLRGVDSCLVGVTPFSWNPASKELTVITDLRIRVSFEGGDGTFGTERLRSRHWDPILQHQLLNFDRLPLVNYSTRDYSGRDGVEYIIIVPDDTDFINWGQTVADFRQEQGISSGVYTVTGIGGNTVAAIESFISNAYNSWSTAPVAFLLLGDYAADGQPGGITSPSQPHPYSGTFVTDNAFADIDGDHLPDLVNARITARNAGELAIMINKYIDYEENPPTAANFYNNPIVACGFQTERWFQLCTDVIYGFWENELGMSPVRQYNIYYGNPQPGDPWSSNANTPMVVDYFGPGGLDYIPATIPAEIDWNSGSPAGINAAINAGAFILQHRDHGSETGWGEPAYGSSNLSGLSNTMLPWVFSINCLTGRFDYSSEVFAEAFHRMPGGALGLTAATQVSYSFVNDTYIFGLYDSMWPDFDPGYPAAGRSTGADDLRPAFANASGKYYLQASNWPYNPGDKQITYDLFHHHSDPFLTLYSQVPSTMNVDHPGVLFAMAPYFTVTAPAGSLIALTRNGQILGVADGTGFPTMVPVPGQLPGLPNMTVTVTKANCYRYQASVEVIPQKGPFVSYVTHLLDDDDSGASNGNGDGIATPGETVELLLDLRNYGVDTAYGVSATVSSTSLHVNFLDDSAAYGDFAPNEMRTNGDGLVFEVLGSCPHGEEIQFTVSATDGSDTWESYFGITVEAAQLALFGQTVVDAPDGNNDGDLDMGETATLELTIENIGAVDTTNVSVTLTSNNPGSITLLDDTADYPDIVAGGTGLSANPHFRFAVDLSTPCGEQLSFDVNIATDQGSAADTLHIQVGGTGLFFADDMESGQGGWTHYADQGADDWSIIASSYAHSPGNCWFSSDPSTVKDVFLVTPDLVVTNLSEFTFWHYFNMESSYDGCVIEISTDGGSSWADLGPSITQGGYTSTISTSFSNPIGGRQAWSGTNSTMSQVAVDLSSFAGSTANVRFRLATDTSVADDGWYIDDVLVTGAECQPWSGGGSDTVATAISCLPGSGTLPFTSSFQLQIENLTGSHRRAGAQLNLVLANGTGYNNWRAGSTVLNPGELFATGWNQLFPALAALAGDNVFTLMVEDVTPAPYNQPPYLPSGDTATGSCTVTGVAP